MDKLIEEEDNLLKEKGLIVEKMMKIDNWLRNNKGRSDQEFIVRERPMAVNTKIELVDKVKVINIALRELRKIDIKQGEESIASMSSKVSNYLVSSGTNGFTCSDHAVLRYIERVHGIDVGKLRAHIERKVNSSKLSSTHVGTQVEKRTCKREKVCYIVNKYNGKVITCHSNLPKY